MKSFYLIIVSLLVSSSFITSQNCNYDDFKIKIDSILQANKIPGAQVAIVTEDSIMINASFGYINIKDSIKTNDDHLFRIGSITKNFTAIAAFQLMEKGEFTLNDKLRDLAPEIPFKNEFANTHPILIKHVMEHTTGFDDIHMKEYATNGEHFNTLEGLTFHPNGRYARWKPGMHSSYCNAGPPMVAFIIEKNTGEKFEEYVEENLFDPLGMTHSSYFLDDYVKNVLSDGHSGNNNTVTDYEHIIDRSSGSINSNATEMSRLIQLYLNDGMVDSISILSKASINRMESVETTIAARQGVNKGYGKYWYNTTYKGMDWWGHNGGMSGYLASLHYQKELGYGYVILINKAGRGLGDLDLAVKNYIYDCNDYNQSNDMNLRPAEFDSAILGYYIPATNRNQMARFLDYLQLPEKLFARNDSLLWKTTFSKRENYLTPIGKNKFLQIAKNGMSSPVIFAKEDDDWYGQVVNFNRNMKKVSAIQAFLPILLAILFALSSAFLVMTVFIRGIIKLFKKGLVLKNPLQWLTASFATLVLTFMVFNAAGNRPDVLQLLGKPSVASILIFLIQFIHGNMFHFPDFNIA